MKKQIHKSIILVIAWTICSFSLFAQVEQYSKVKVYADENRLHELAKAGIDLTEGTHKRGEYLICDYSEREIQKIQDLGFKYEILIEDVSEFYAERNIGLYFLNSNPSKRLRP